MRKITDFPFHPFFISAFSVLSLLAFNLADVTVLVGIRPFILMLTGTGIAFLFLKLILKDWQSAGIVTSIWIILFITYGHVYQLLEKNPFMGISLGRHRYLLPIYVLAAGLSVWWVVRKKAVIRNFTQLLNLLSTFLFVFSIIQMTVQAIEVAGGEKQASTWTFSQTILQPDDPENLPDVYFIVLDTYTRKDALEEDFFYDNSPFLAELERFGFYVAECSQSNYLYTQGSITSALNLDYVSSLTDRLSSIELEGNIWILLKQSLVRAQLERIGYKSVAFETSYEWSRVRDADIFLGEKYSSLDFQIIEPFERLWANSTMLILLNDLEILTRGTEARGLAHPWASHIQEQLFVLDTLPKIAKDGDPTFTFVHILIPHVPYVFAADGSILTDPGYFSMEDAGPINEEYLQKGYTGEISFINDEMLRIISEILSISDTQPIIVIMGDHGLRGSNRAKNLLALYFPDRNYQNLYPEITPVNSFRIIFNQFFGTTYALLEDQTFGEDGLLIQESCNDIK